jgi:hypothetical protein
MLAFETSLLCLRALGLDAYAQESEEWLANEAQKQGELGVTPEKVITSPISNEAPYTWIYGHAFLLGRELRDGVGWEHMKRLATSLNDDFKVDIRRWVASLPSNLQKKARAVLRVREALWV